MIFAWIFLASLGMLVARYYKFVFPYIEMFDKRIWFIIHQSIMILVVVITFISVIVIFTDKKWRWTHINAALVETWHSIFGIFLIATAAFQVIKIFP